MKRLITISLMLLVVGSGCNPFLKLYYGVKKPEFMSDKEIRKFQKDIKLGSADYFGVRPEVYLKMRDHSFPNVYVFDRDGRYIDFRDTVKPNCNGPAEQFLAELTPEHKYYYSDTYNLNSYIALLEGSSCQPSDLKLQSDVDFYIFMNYVTFIGKKLHRQKTLPWLEALESNKNIKYQLTLINEDLKSCWSDEQKKLFEKK